MSGQIQELLHTRLREAGLRLTLPRRTICHVLASNGEAFLTAADIVTKAHERIGHIDPSTVYRTLDDFARLGIVHQVQVGSHPGQWHLTLDHDHLHLMCEACERPTLVESSDVGGFFDRLEERHGFTVNTHHFVVLGVCRECRTSGDSHSHRPTTH